MTILEPVMDPVLLPFELAMKAAILSPADAIIMSGVMLLIEPAIRPVMLTLKSLVLAVLTAGVGVVVCRGGRRDGKGG